MVLVVEDEARVRKLAARFLNELGYEVLTAADGYDALEVAGRENPDLVLLDLMLPGVDGLELCRTLRNRSKVPVIMLTARGDEMDRILGLEMGADDYLPKPFSARELLARIKAVLRRTTRDSGVESLTTGALQAVTPDDAG